MEEKVSVWKANLNSGLIMGLVGIVYTLVIYFLDLTLNKVQGYDLTCNSDFSFILPDKIIP